MGNTHNTQARCAAIVAALGREWGLTPEQQAAYVQALLEYLPGPSDDEQLQRLAVRYHLEHQEVQALLDPQDPGHQDAWRNWHTQAIKILRSANIHWLSEGAIDFEDLTQSALEELHRSIASYRYNSRFSTWAYTVIVRAGKRTLRALRAAKRTGAIVSLDDPTLRVQLVDSMADPEVNSSVAELNALINAILSAEGGQRWVEIFQLRTYDDQRLTDIGRQLGLSASRVSILLDHMRTLLRRHPDLREWRGLMESGLESLDDAENKDDG